MLKQSDYKGLVESILLQLAIGDVHNAHSVANPIGFDAEPNITNHFELGVGTKSVYSEFKHA